MPIFKLGLLASTFAFLSACSTPKESYLISIFETPSHTNESWLEELNNYIVGINYSGGELLSPPLMVEKELKNDAQPKYTSTLQGNVMTLIDFPNDASLEDYDHQRMHLSWSMASRCAVF